MLKKIIFKLKSLFNKKNKEDNDIRGVENNYYSIPKTEWIYVTFDAFFSIYYYTDKNYLVNKNNISVIRVKMEPTETKFYYVLKMIIDKYNKKYTISSVSAYSKNSHKFVGECKGDIILHDMKDKSMMKDLMLLIEKYNN